MQTTSTAVDHVKSLKEGMNLVRLEQLLSDIDYQPRWQLEAQRSADYYDGKQLDAEVLKVMKERGQAPITFNLIGPAIDGVLGMEAKTRTDWICRADNDDGLEVAEGLNEKLNEATRMTEANKACSDAYAAQVKTGLGWVEVNKNTSNPLAYQYRCNYVHRRELHWDWFAKKPDLSDSRYVIREKWIDADQALVAFPQHENLINCAVNDWGSWLALYRDMEVPEELYHAYEDYTKMDRNESEYYDYGRKRLKVYEVWYRQPVKKTFIKTNSGRVLVYDQKNPVHRAAVAGRHVEVFPGTFPEMRLSFFLGPHRIMDIASPLPHGNFPYIPFWGFREDGTGIPYGLIRRMMSPQDEVNARRTKMIWLLTAKHIIMDSDATDMTLEEVVDEAHRGDGVFILNPNRQNRDQNAFRVEQQFQLATQQFQVMKDAEDMIQNTSGIYNAMLGKNEDAQSGVAISSLVEQSSTTLAELNDNYRYARRLVGEHHLNLIVADMGRKEEEVVINVNKPQKTKRVILNKTEQDEHGNARVTNDVMRTKTKVVLDEITATAGYRAQIANRIMDIIATLPDELKGPLMPLAIEATDIPKRDEMVKVLNRVLGTDVDPATMDDEEREQYEARQAEAAKLKQQEFDRIQADIEKVRAEALKITGETESNTVDNAETQAKTEKLLAEMEKITVEIQAMKKDQLDRIDAEQTTTQAESFLNQLDIEGAVS